MARVSVAEMNKRIAAKLKEVDRDQARINSVWRIIAKKNATERELEQELRTIRRIQDWRWGELKKLRGDLDEIKEGGIKPDERQEFIELQRRREQFADKIDEGVAAKQHLLERLDEVAENKRELRERINDLVDERKDDRQDVERMRKRKQRIKEQRAQRNQPSEHFTYAEFDCNDGTPHPEASEPAIKALCEQVLEPQRSRFGTVHINSGYRTPAYNAAIGGATNSVHIYSAHPAAVAADHTCASGSATDWFNNTAGKADGRGRYGSFHHADNRNRMGWPDATWSG
jgi:hypothetical protein